MSYGDQRRLEIARAIAPEPALLMLDEPAAGMNPAETEALATLIQKLRQGAMTVLLVEHDMGFVMGLCDTVTVLNFGRLIFDGAAHAARQDPGVIEAYLGPKVAARLAAGGMRAGKTTLFNLISGLVTPSAGRIWLGDVEMTTLRPEQRARLGMGRTFQNIRVFGAMTALENVLTGLQTRMSAGIGAVLFRTPGFRAEERRAVERGRAALDVVGLADKADVRAGGLSYGDQRRLEIARAIAPEPALLMLDEPAAGMNPAETEALATLIQKLRQGAMTVLLVEHDMGFVMGLCDTVTVLNFGRLIFDGAAHAARQDPGVIEAYLGPKVAARLAAGGMRAGIRGA